MPVFALLDDAEASAERPASRLYTDFVREHRCIDPSALDATCVAVQADLAAGLHAVLLADYEWGAKLIGAGLAKLPPNDASSLRVLVFASLQHLSADGAAGWLAECEGRDEPAPAGTLALTPEIGRDTFGAAIDRIHEAIRDGETYQVNFTYRLRGEAFGDPVALYRRLRARQRVGYGALIRLPLDAAKGGDAPGRPGDAAVEWVLSRSPELFVRHERGELTARPMKGTAVRASAPEGDSETARLLHDDVKNRAENLMIVDLLRNDLGRIAQLGSVQVPELFRVEPYATVFQMTSTVRARRRPEVDLAALLRAIFPCGSITGAPKHHTMDWIAALEVSPRGLYTGAIGWLDAGDGVCPDLCLSVAIRTLLLGAPHADGTRAATLGVGGGIVLDSVAHDEHDETLWKARFLTSLDPGLTLFETIRLTPRDGAALRVRHRARLAQSAARLGFPFDAEAFDRLIDAVLKAQAATLAAGRALRLRIDLHADGRLTETHGPLVPLPDRPVRLRLADAPLPALRPLAALKTSDRAVYDAGIRAAETVGAFDTLHFDAAGRLVEGGRCNVFVRLGGSWVTPPLSAGALSGVMRSVLLEDIAWAAVERPVTREQLVGAEAVMVCNALRGVLPAIVDAGVDGA